MGITRRISAVLALLFCLLYAGGAQAVITLSPTEIKANNIQSKVSPVADIRAYGAKADDGADDTTAIQAAIDAVSTRGSGTVYVPCGTWEATSITRKSYVTIRGENTRCSKIRARTSASTGLFVLPVGPVQQAHLENLTLEGGNGSPANAGQWAIYSEAQALGVSPFHGGEWWSNHKNLTIKYFDNGLWYKAGDTGSLLPHQFVTHENVDVVRASNTGVSLKLTGQCGQFADINGRYDGVTEGQGTNIFLGRNGGTNAPYIVNFLGVTSQTAERAFDIDYGRNINIFGGNFEQLDRAIRVSAASANVTVTGSKFANAGSDGVSGGYIIKMGSTSAGTFEGNYVFGTFDKVVANDSTQYGFYTSGNNFGGITDLTSTHTSGMTVQKSVTTGPPVSLDLYTLRDVLVNTTASTITQINSLLMPGEILHLRALSGPFTLGTGGNITLGGPSSVIVPQNAHAIMKRADTGGTWELISLSEIPDSVSADNGNAAKTLTVATSEITQIWNTALTADRAVTLSTTGAYNGAVFHIVRTAAATGAFNLNVGTGPLKALAAGTWCEVKYNGSAWVLTKYGTL